MIAWGAFVLLALAVTLVLLAVVRCEGCDR